MPLHPDFKRIYSDYSDTITPCVWMPFCDKGLLYVETSDGISLLQQAPEPVELCTDCLALGSLNGVTYIAIQMSDEDAITSAKPLVSRNLYGKIPLLEWLIAGYAAQILHWRKTSAYCPVCGGLMSLMGKEWARKCSECGHERYPQISPALLMLVHDGAGPNS